MRPYPIFQRDSIVIFRAGSEPLPMYQVLSDMWYHLLVSVDFKLAYHLYVNGKAWLFIWAMSTYRVQTGSLVYSYPKHPATFVGMDFASMLPEISLWASSCTWAFPLERCAGVLSSWGSSCGFARNQRWFYTELPTSVNLGRAAWQTNQNFDGSWFSACRMKWKFTLGGVGMIEEVVLFESKMAPSGTTMKRILYFEFISWVNLKSILLDFIFAHVLGWWCSRSARFFSILRHSTLLNLGWSFLRLLLSKSHLGAKVSALKRAINVCLLCLFISHNGSWCN